MTDYNWTAFNDTEFARLLRNAEGRNELERSMYLEAARRIELRDRDTTAAEAVKIEREACKQARPSVDKVDYSIILGWDKMTSGERHMWRVGYLCGCDDYIDAIRYRDEVSK